MKKTTLSLFTLAMVCIAINALTYSASAPPAGNTGAPGESNCTSCHAGPTITSGANWNNVSLTSNIPAGGYTPGSSYAITVSHTQNGINKFGFQTTALTSSNTAAGTFTAGTGSSIQQSGGRNYINHTPSGTAGSGSKSWSFTWTAPNSGVGAVTFYVAVNATNSSGNEVGDQIYLKSFSFNEHVPGPAPTAIITADKTMICVGDTVKYQGSGDNNPTSFGWQFSGGTPNVSTQQNVNVIYNTAGTYNARLITENANGQSQPVLQEIRVFAKPAATITTQQGQTVICGNDSFTMSGPVGVKYKYLWTPMNDTNRIIVIKNSVVVQLTVTDSNNCSAKSSAVNVLQKPKPDVTLSLSKDSVCQGDTVTFTAGSQSSVLSYTFFRTGTNGQIYQAASSNIFKTAFQSTTDSVTVVSKDSFCTSVDAPLFQVWVKPRFVAPNVTTGTVSSQSITFLWDSVAGANTGDYEISIDSGSTWVNPSGTREHILTGLQSNTTIQIWVRVKDTAPCNGGSIGVAQATTGICNKPSFVISYNPKICLASDAATVNVPVTIQNLSLSKYSIKFNTGNYASNTMFNAVVGNANQQVNISIIDSLNLSCAPTDTLVLLKGEHQPNFQPAIVLNAPTCTNGVLDVSLANTLAARYTIKYFRNDSIFLTSSTNYKDSLHNWNNEDLIHAVITDTVTGCSKNSNAFLIEKTPLLNAGYSVAKENLHLIVTDTTVGSVRREWLVSAGAKSYTSTDADFHLMLDSAGTYTVLLKVWSADSCQSHIDGTVDIVSTGIAQISTDQIFDLYPNPVRDELTIRMKHQTKESFVFRLFNATGQLVYEETIKASETKIDTHNFSDGIYYYHLMSGEHYLKGKLLK